MKVYKYMSMKNYEKFVKNKTLRLTKAHSQNDPFEFLLSTTYLDGLFNSNDGKKNFNDYLNMSGCISMSTTKESIYMWSHYADNHKGVSLEFTFDESDPKSLFFGMANVFENSHIASPSGFQCGSVVYQRSREVSKKINNLNDILSKSYFIKSDDWDKEYEYRFILPFAESCEILFTPEGVKKALHNIKFEGFEQRFINENSNKKYPFKINGLSLDFLLGNNHITTLSEIWGNEGDDCIFVVRVNSDKLTGIYFGCKSNINGNSYIPENFFSKLDGSIHGVYKASADDDEFKLNFTPLNTTLFNAGK
ncbi:TPA: DUF2971 domain-containing protein [Yersinia enterocolitica]|nr:DUF2971 domain-containing protein [Yersinia enterocolitica]